MIEDYSILVEGNYIVWVYPQPIMITLLGDVQKNYLIFRQSQFDQNVFLKHCIIHLVSLIFMNFQNLN